jgi:endoglucanase
MHPQPAGPAQANRAKADGEMVRQLECDNAGAVGRYVAAADAVDKLPLLVAYNIPGRDACGGHSGGGAGSVAAYDAWIASFAAAIGNRPAVVVLEPDSLGDFGCMSQSQIDDRVGMLSRAVNQFRSKAPNPWAYLDAGNPGWIDAATMAQRLNMAGAAGARGFALNVSNYFPTGDNINFGNRVASELRRYGFSKPFVIDTSRNGNGSNGQWCNPAGRRIGTPSQLGGARGCCCGSRLRASPTAIAVWVVDPARVSSCRRSPTR